MSLRIRYPYIAKDKSLDCGPYFSPNEAFLIAFRFEILILTDILGTRTGVSLQQSVPHFSAMKLCLLVHHFTLLVSIVLAELVLLLSRILFKETEDIFRLPSGITVPYKITFLSIFGYWDRQMKGL
jgi:hypothetical protein